MMKKPASLHVAFFGLMLAIVILANTAYRAKADFDWSPFIPKISGSWYPPGATPLNESSGNVAAATATATLPATAGVTNWATGYDINGSGATAASAISCTVTGLAGGTETRTVVVPAGATAALTPLSVRFPEPVPASAANVAIAASCPSFGSGNTNATVNLYGFQTTRVP